MTNNEVDDENKELHRHWALGGTEHSILTTELEWTILRFSSAFERCCVQLCNISSDIQLNYQEIELLHVVAMQHRPQLATTLARQLNRDDLANLQYTLRKLLSSKLLTKTRGARGKTTTYEATEEGVALVKRYAKMRERLLTDKTEYIDDIDEKLKEANNLISLLTGIYDDVARTSATYGPVIDNLD